MARKEFREVVTCLRDGSLWVGRFATGDGELDFGDDRFDSAHGLARYARTTPVRWFSEAMERRLESRHGAPCSEGRIRSLSPRPRGEPCGRAFGTGAARDRPRARQGAS